MTKNVQAIWIDNSYGRKDYDGPILSISSRYRPKGGATLMFDPAEPEKVFDDGTDCTAVSSLLLHYAEDGSYNCLVLRGKDFSGFSFDEVSAQVEQWVHQQYEKACAILSAAFKQDCKLIVGNTVKVFTVGNSEPTDWNVSNFSLSGDKVDLIDSEGNRLLIEVASIFNLNGVWFTTKV